MDETKPHQLPASAGAGTLIGGRYLLGQLVGRGGVADVYQAEDQLLARSVAIKLFRPDGASMDGAGLDGAGLDGAGLDGAERHQAEIRLLARLNHPGLVAIYDAGVLAADGQLARPYLVMELVIGPSLAERLRRGPLSEQHAVALGGELADALAYIHRREVVHRDVKPANILLGQSEPGSTKLADFGIARASADPRLTGDGLTLGTAQYLSPEQAMGGPVGPASDIYSLGLVLLECLTGEPAFTGPAIEVAVARLHRDPLVPTNLDPAIAELLRQMTAREPDARPSAAEVSGQLRPTGTMGPVLDRPTALLPPAAPAPSGG
ncbi:MAG: serine/threonine-protein kinase, partial [Jatrophihabitantaceae bacterium]